MSHDFQVIDTKSDSVIAAGDDLEDLWGEIGLQIGEANEEDLEEDSGWLEWD